MGGDAATGSRVIEHAASPRLDPSWGPLYKAGGWSALLYVLLVLVPVVLVFVAPLPPTQGAALLEYIAAHQVVYLVELVCFVGLAVPALVVFSAVSVALKNVNKQRCGHRWPVRDRLRGDRPGAGQQPTVAAWRAGRAQQRLPGCR